MEHDDSPERGTPKARPQDLPSVDKLLRMPVVQALVLEHGHALVAGECRGLLDGLRTRALAGALSAAQAAASAIETEVRARVEARLAPRLRAVLNLTGTVIHTNLGRALLADAAIEHLVRTMSGPNNLEFDLDSGRRGDRDTVVEDLLCSITGAEAATVVNNNAAAVLLTIAALARGREVIVSRGELVEIRASPVADTHQAGLRSSRGLAGGHVEEPGAVRQGGIDEGVPVVRRRTEPLSPANLAESWCHGHLPRPRAAKSAAS